MKLAADELAPLASRQSLLPGTVLHIQVFCLSFSVLHFVILISGSKSVKFAQKFRIFLNFLTREGTLTGTIHSYRPIEHI